jgi:hypothetical protein
MGKKGKKSISVFIASPGDLMSERRVFKDTIDELNKGFGEGKGVEFVPVGWEDQNAEAGRRVQDVLNRQVEKSDLFVLVLYGRWGQKAPDSSYSSYTEEEFQLAMHLWEERKSPEVIVFFKNIDGARIADPGPQLTQVLDFKKKLEERRDILFRAFNSEADFGQQIDKHLRDFASGEWGHLDNENAQVSFSKGIARSMTTAERTSHKQFKADLSLVHRYQKEFALARAAMDAAANKRIEDAKILFAQATEETADLSILAAAAEFYRQVNDIENASRMVLRQASIAHDRTIAAQHYVKLAPEGYMASVTDQVIEKMLEQTPSQWKAEVREIFKEVYRTDKLEKIRLDMIVRYFTLEEIVQLSTFLASPIGQSCLVKTTKASLEMMQYGQEESLRVIQERHPEWVKDLAKEQPPILDAEPIPQLQAPAKTRRQLVGVG